MNIEVQNLDSLRKLVRELQNENKRLKMQLKQANIPYAEENVFEDKIVDIAEYDPDQGERIIRRYITDKMIQYYPYRNRVFCHLSES